MGNKTAISMTKREREKKESGEHNKNGQRRKKKRTKKKERGSLKVDKEITKKVLHAEESRKRDTRETITSTS